MVGMEYTLYMVCGSWWKPHNSKIRMQNRCNHEKILFLCKIYQNKYCHDTDSRTN
jgi:hypothetical protein